MLRDDLLNLLNKHRQEAFVTCEESCICWELERIIYEFDQDQQGNLTIRAVDGWKCPPHLGSLIGDFCVVCLEPLTRRH